MIKRSALFFYFKLMGNDPARATNLSTANDNTNLNMAMNERKREKQENDQRTKQRKGKNKRCQINGAPYYDDTSDRVEEVDLI